MSTRLELVDTVWDMVEPFVTASEVTTCITVVTVTLRQAGHQGRAETLGADYLGETAVTIKNGIEAVRKQIEAGLTRDQLQELLPPGGARNGLDCALWDLEAKRSGRRVWELLGMDMQPVHTVFTLAMGDGDAMAAKALAHRDMPHLKLKLNGVDTADKIAAIRKVRPDARIMIDANGSWSPSLLDRLGDVLAANKIELLEQPLPMGHDQPLRGLNYPVPLCADESCQSSADLERVADCYDAINIKLDKCGGLTDGLKILAWCKNHGKQVMVGNMLGSSLAMAPAMIIAQQAAFVDLDGPLWQTRDSPPAIRYAGSLMPLPDKELWG
ncbi:MAG: dipeptide epimerase [Gammaproteobacteria bacterium]|nr:dipeptide epimerase [Gammaproteobacteria bacterium]